MANNALPILLIGGAAALVLAGGKKKKQRSPEEWMIALAKKTGNPDLDPSQRDPKEIITELQITLGIEPADGQWSPQLEQAIREMYKEL